MAEPQYWRQLGAKPKSPSQKEGGKVAGFSIGRPWEATARDINQDGHSDIFWRNTVTGTMWVQYLRDGDPIGGFALPYALPVTSNGTMIRYSQSFGSFGSNGLSVLQHNPTTGVLSIHPFPPRRTDDAVVIEGFLALGGEVLTGDINHNQFDNIIIRRPNGVVLVAHRLNSDPTSFQIHATAVGAPLELMVGDFTRCNAHGFLWRNPSTGTIWWQTFSQSSPTGGLSDLNVVRPWIMTGCQIGGLLGILAGW